MLKKDILLISRTSVYCTEAHKNIPVQL